MILFVKGLMWDEIILDLSPDVLVFCLTHALMPGPSTTSLAWL